MEQAGFTQPNLSLRLTRNQSLKANLRAFIDVCRLGEALFDLLKQFGDGLLNTLSNQSACDGIDRLNETWFGRIDLFLNVGQHQSRQPVLHLAALIAFQPVQNLAEQRLQFVHGDWILPKDIFDSPNTRGQIAHTAQRLIILPEDKGAQSVNVAHRTLVFGAHEREPPFQIKRLRVPRGLVGCRCNHGVSQRSQAVGQHLPPLTLFVQLPVRFIELTAQVLEFRSQIAHCH